MLSSKARLSATALAVALVTALPYGVASAVDLTLSDEEISEAVQEGIDQANDPAHGFQVEDYVLFGAEDPLKIAEGARLVDAVIVSSPRERLLYESYLAQFEGSPLTTEKARSLADSFAGQVGFRVFAHSEDLGQENKGFLQGFGSAQLIVDGEGYPAESADIFGPGQDFFILPNGKHVIRWLGSVTFIFDAASLPSTTGPMTLVFEDGEGNAYSYDVDLADYR